MLHVQACTSQPWLHCLHGKPFQCCALTMHSRPGLAPQAYLFLLASSSVSSSSSWPQLLGCGAGRQPHPRRFQTPAQAAAEKPQPHTNGHHSHDSHPQPNKPNQEPTTSSNGATHSQHRHQQAVPHAQQQGQGQAGQGPMQPPGQSQEDAAASGQLVDALFAVLQQPLLPSTCLWQVGWLLSQLLAHAQAGIGQLVPHHQKQLEQVRVTT